jgi:hypothetical protein
MASQSLPPNICTSGRMACASAAHFWMLLLSLHSAAKAAAAACLALLAAAAALSRLHQGSDGTRLHRHLLFVAVKCER